MQIEHGRHPSLIVCRLAHRGFLFMIVANVAT
jgi:hypothetical protein